MKSISLSVLFILLLSLANGCASKHKAPVDWKPAPGPLLSKFAADVDPRLPLAEYPRPQMQRKAWVNLNGLWQLALAKPGEAPPIGIDLPNKILVPFPVESQLSGVGQHSDRLWYRRTFKVPTDWDGHHVLLNFGAVDYEAAVYINGTLVGTHKGGYDPFSINITHALLTHGDQELIVGVYDPTDSANQPRGKQALKPGGIFYTPSTGIWQTVWIEGVNPNHIDSLKITPDVDNSSVYITVNTQSAPGLQANIEILDDKGNHILTRAKGDPNSPIRVRIPDPHLWTPDDPYLYRLNVSIDHFGKANDTVRSYFAMRKASVGRDEKGITRILLNDKFVFQVGTLDQGYWPDGLHTAPTDAALKYDIEMHKLMGFNMIRKHIKVEPQRWYYWADKLGILVWQDMPSSGDYGLRENQRHPKTVEDRYQHEVELQKMLENLHNHPSIILWVVFNEGWGQSQAETVKLTKLVKDLDPSRIVTNASGWDDYKVGDVIDMHNYPGPGSPKPEITRAAVLGEFGGLGHQVLGHTWAKEFWGYGQGIPSQAELTRQYARLLQRSYQLKDNPGLSAIVYTQITDVETECNGLLTYDRAVIKVDPAVIAAANRGDFTGIPQILTVIPTSEEQPQQWRHTTTKPADNWFTPAFDSSAWKEAPGVFGTANTPGANIRTTWSTPDIWMRREFTLSDKPLNQPMLRIHHDEDAEVYINGILAARLTGYTTGYDEVAISKQALATLKPGKNTFAVHCHQTGGGQCIDVGIIQMK